MRWTLRTFDTSGTLPTFLTFPIGMNVLNVCPNCQIQILADVPGKPSWFKTEVVTFSPLCRFAEFFRAGYITNVRYLFFLFFLTHPFLIMVSKQHRNRFLAARFIFEKSFPVMFPCYVSLLCFPVMFPCSGCKTTNPNHFEKSCIVAPNNDVCSHCVRLNRHCDLFISESVC